MKQDQLALVLLTQTRVSVGNLISLQQILLHFLLIFWLIFFNLTKLVLTF